MSFVAKLFLDNKSMFLSVLKVSKDVDAVNMDFIVKNVTSKGFSIIKQAQKDVEAGINISGFTLEKDGISMTTFVFHPDKNSFVCAGYYNGTLIKEKQCLYESDIPKTLIEIFQNIRHRTEDEPIRFDMQLQRLRIVCQRIEQKQKNLNTFTQQVKTTSEYEEVKSQEKKAYQKIISDTSRILQEKDSIKAQNASLIDPLLKIESCKQSLQTTIMAFEEENAYLSNVNERIRQNLDNLRTSIVQVTPANIKDNIFSNYVNNLVKIKELELKQKYMTK